MFDSNILHDARIFSETLYEKMKCINIGIEDLELYEFQYALNNLFPADGWSSVELDEKECIEKMVSSNDFFSSIQIRPRVGDRIVLDENIVRLTRMLLIGLVTGKYSDEWIRKHFFFDVRGFYFLVRTAYFTDKALSRLGGKPFKCFEQRQKRLERRQDISYKEFKEANAEIDQFFMDCVGKLIAVKGTPVVLAIAGPTAAGKTEIVDRLRALIEQDGPKVATIEIDNFLTDRDQREAKGIHTLGKEALHFELLKQAIENILQGRKISIPRYDFVFATSSHDLDGHLKPGGVPIEIEPANIIFMEGNFPFLVEDLARLIGIKVVYLTDDAIRLKRKWKRDIDYRKKYEPSYFRNRLFKEQFIMAQAVYRPQMEVCDMVVDTTGAALWTTAEIAEALNRVGKD